VILRNCGQSYSPFRQKNKNVQSFIWLSTNTYPLQTYPCLLGVMCEFWKTSLHWQHSSIPIMWRQYISPVWSPHLHTWN